MPLPPDSSLALLPHTNPGESGYSRPKQAMIVRMTADTLDALQNYNGEKPLLDFDFGDVPGIHIGGIFYPMRPVKEDTPHELYLRTSTATKQSAPLKHYANVTGKFTVEPGLDRVKDMLREKTSDAAKQREDRRTIFIDAPPPPPPKQKEPAAAKKKKDHTSSMFRNAVRPSDQAKLNAAMSSSAAAAVNRVASPAPAKPRTNDASAPVRRRLIHFLAVSDRQQDTIIKMVAGSGCDADSRQELLDLLKDVGEHTTPLKRGEDPGTKVWRLKTESWKEVRPFDWPKLQEKERIAMSRTGKQKLSSIGITESDPIWKHFVYRPSSGTSLGESSSASRDVDMRTTEVAPKRGVSSKEAKEKKAKPRADPNAEIQVKDESAKAIASTSKARKLEASSQSQLKPAAGRKLPGSGFKMGKTPPTGSPNTTPAPKPQPDARTQPSSSLSSKPSKSSKPSPAPSLPPTQDQRTAPSQRIRNIKESDTTAGGTDSERERGYERPREKGKARAAKEYPEEGRRTEAVGQKRKQVAPEDDYSDASVSKPAPQKKRKTETNSATTAPPRDAKTRDLSLPKKPDLGLPPPRTKAHRDASSFPPPPPSPLPKIKKEHAPPPLPKIKKEATPVNAKASGSLRESREPSTSQRGRTESKASGTSVSKPRRKSPIYTTSEDEGEIRRPKREGLGGPLPTPPSNSNHNHSSGTSSSSTQSPSHHRSRHARERDREPKPLPTDHAALRARYKTTYGEYLAVYQRMFTQKSRIQNLLDRGDGYGSAAESDTGDLMDSDDLKGLSVNYQRLHEELMAMRARFDKSLD